MKYIGDSVLMLVVSDLKAKEVTKLSASFLSIWYITLSTDFVKHSVQLADLSYARLSPAHPPWRSIRKQLVLANHRLCSRVLLRRECWKEAVQLMSKKLEQYPLKDLCG